MDEASEEFELSPRAFFRLGFFFELGLAGAAMAAAAIFLDPPYPFRLGWEGGDLLAALAAAAPAAGAALCITSRVASRLSALDSIYERVKGLVGPALRGLTVSEILLLSAAAGLGEEVLFRGLIQSWLGFWLTSLLFGLIHALTPAYFVLGTLFGMAFGWLALATGNLLAPICAHAVYDAVAFYRYRQRLREEGGAGSAEEAATAAEAAGGSASGSDSASASASASDSASDSDSASAPASDPDPPVASKP